MLNKLAYYTRKFSRIRRERRRDELVQRYLLANPQLAETIQAADSSSQSTGADLGDYVVLHSLIRSRKPAYVLECGTGRSTWVIAQALLENSAEQRPGKVFSMEHGREWFEHAREIFPEHCHPVAELCYSPMEYDAFSFVRGTAYEHIPEHPYELVFVDGPDQEAQRPDGSQEVLCNLDFVRLVLRSDRPVTALIDYRMHTVIAYTLFFGPDKVSFFDAWKLGLVEGVTRHDFLLNHKGRVRRQLFEHVAPINRGMPPL